jgi:hypothetical protein
MLQTETIDARHTREAIEREISVFEERAGQFIRGEITDDQFRPPMDNASPVSRCYA